MKIVLGNLIGSGAGSDVYEYGEGKVCKLYKQGCGSVQHEYDIMMDAQKNGLPVPHIYEMVEYNGRFGFIMERIYGTSLLAIMIDHITVCHFKGLSNKDFFYSSIIETTIKDTVLTLFNLHQIKCNLNDTVKSALSRSCKYNSYLTSDEKEKIGVLIDQLPEADTVCHGDPNPGNLFKQNGKVILIDWNNCARGSYYYDIAEYILMMRYSDVSIDLPDYVLKFLSEYKVEFSNIFCFEYQKIGKIDSEQLSKWFIPVLVSKMGGNHSEMKQKMLINDLRTRLRVV